MSGSTLWKVKVDVHQIYNLKLANSTELPDPYIAATLEFPPSSDTVVATQRTAAKSKTSSGIFNAVLLFIANINDYDFNKVKLVVRVHNGRKLTELLESDGALIGSCTFALSKIFGQAKHWVPREWFPVTSATSPGDCRGYVNLSIGVFGPGNDVPSQLNDFQLLAVEGINEKLALSRSINEKIVQTPETNFNNSMLVFNVLRAENLPVVTSQVSGSSTLAAVPCSAYVRISFAGVKLQTRVITTNSNPAWNESLRIPVLYPNWDQNVLVEVFSRAPNGAKADIFLGIATFDFEVLYSQGIQPTWFNLYSGAGSIGGDYAGRVQVAANVARSSDMNANVVPVDTSAIKEPPTDEIILYVDIYELGFLDDVIQPDQIPSELWIQVQFGPNVFESQHISNCPMTCVFGESLGRLDPVRVHLPVDRSMAYDMVLSVCGGENREQICFSRIPLVQFLMTLNGPRDAGAKVSGDPEWIRLCRVSSGTSGPGVVRTLTNMFMGSESTSVVSGDDSLQTVANILVNLVAFPIEQGALTVPQRPLRIPYEISSYELRMVLHQAANLPIAPGAMTNGTLSSTFARVTLAGVSSRTTVIPNTLNPVWNELVRIEVDLPKIPTLRPDVLVEVVENGTGTILGSVSIKTNTLRPQLNGPPNWYKLSTSSRKRGLGVAQESLVLCAATLVSKEEAEKFTIPSAIPQRATFTIDLLIVGVRLLRNYSIERLNQIELSWGRHKSKPSRRVVTVRTSDPIAGVGGQFNFLQPALMDIDLPVDSIFQEFLEVRLIERIDSTFSVMNEESPTAAGWFDSLVNGAGEDRGGIGVRDKAIGFGFIHLNPQYTWISDSEKAQFRETFRMKTVEELRKIEEQRAAEESSKAALNKSRVHTRSKSHTVKKSMNKDLVELQYIEDEIDAHFGLSMTGENVIEYPIDCFNAVETDALLPADFRSSQGASAANKTGRRGGADLTSLSNRRVSKFMSEFVWEPTISKE
jgi:hypothetical protein